MKKCGIASKCVLIAMSTIGVAHASSFNWTGFYAGVDAGVIFNNADLTSEHLGFNSPSGTCDMSEDFATFAPGVQVGYMYQFAHSIVAGIEVNTTFNTNQEYTFSCKSQYNPHVYDNFMFQNQTQTAVKGRLARAVNWSNTMLLPYLTVGASFAHLGLKYENEGGDHYSTNNTETGWLIGAGLEWSFLQHWSLRAEYDFMDYGDAIHLDVPSVYGLIDNNGEGQVSLKTNAVFVSINYWIG